MESATSELAPTLWCLGWAVALGVLFYGGLRLPLQTGLARGWSSLYDASVVLGALIVTVAANAALVLHDVHVDLTRERLFTPSGQALRVVDSLRQPVELTYFYRAQDSSGRRLKEVLDLMARRNPLLRVRSVDPDRQPAAAQRLGVRTYNTAVLVADDRRLVVQTVDESEVAIGIQRVLRERVVTVCFLEGHNELPMDSFEFHTHVEGLAGHSHDDASSSVVETTGHGIGRLRRALEAQGYATRKIALATAPEVPRECRALIVANPRTTFLPAESAALDAYLREGGALLAMLDLGFVLEPRLSSLMERLGVRLPQEAVVDPLSHYSSDAEMVAATTYATHPTTRSISMTFYPGTRPLRLVAPAPGIQTAPLFYSSRDSYTRTVQPVAARALAPDENARKLSEQRGPQVLAVAAQGRLPGAPLDRPQLRAIVVGDGDFASNSFLPYLANSDLAMAMVRWLVREEQVAAVASRIPAPPMILLSGAQTKAIFVTVEGLLPLGVLALGAVAWWRRR